MGLNPHVAILVPSLILILVVLVVNARVWLGVLNASLHPAGV